MKPLPETLKQYFWDVDFSKLNYEKRPRYVIERILEFGDENAVNWMMEKFSREQIVATLKKSRQLSRKSANFWAFFLKVDKEQVRCLQKFFQGIREKFWPY